MGISLKTVQILEREKERRNGEVSWERATKRTKRGKEKVTGEWWEEKGGGEVKREKE